MSLFSSYWHGGAGNTSLHVIMLQESLPETWFGSHLIASLGHLSARPFAVCQCWQVMCGFITTSHPHKIWTWSGSLSSSVHSDCADELWTQWCLQQTVTAAMEFRLPVVVIVDAKGFPFHALHSIAGFLFSLSLILSLMLLYNSWFLQSIWQICIAFLQKMSSFCMEELAIDVAFLSFQMHTGDWDCHCHL
jgi:hypothetical protein